MTFERKEKLSNFWLGEEKFYMPFHPKLSESKRGLGHMRADYFGVSSEKDQNVNDFLLQPDLVKRGHHMKT